MEMSNRTETTRPSSPHACVPAYRGSASPPVPGRSPTSERPPRRTKARRQARRPWIEYVVHTYISFLSLLGRNEPDSLTRGFGVLVTDVPVVALARSVGLPDAIAHPLRQAEPVTLAHEHLRRDCRFAARRMTVM